jgi:hypothetical protein
MRRVERIAKPAEHTLALPVFRVPVHPDSGGPMYATIRRYSIKNVSKPAEAFQGLKQRLEQKFLHTLQDIRGFHGYYVLTSNERELVTVSIFENRTGAQESTRRAAEFVKSDPLKDNMSSPEIFEGELLVSKEGMVGAH